MKNFLCGNFFHSLFTAAMSGRQMDGVWKAFDRKKEDGKSYFLATCKGCGESMAGLVNGFRFFPWFCWGGCRAHRAYACARCGMREIGGQKLVVPRRRSKGEEAESADSAFFWCHQYQGISLRGVLGGGLPTMVGFRLTNLSAKLGNLCSQPMPRSLSSRTMG